MNTQTAKKETIMPLLNFTVVTGRTPQEIRQLLDSAHAAVVEAFGVPDRDRYQIVNVREPDQVIALDTGLDIERSDRLVIIEVASRQRTDAQKQRLFELLAEKMQRDRSLDPNDLIVSITENRDADWSFGKGRAQFLTGELNEQLIVRRPEGPKFRAYTVVIKEDSMITTRLTSRFGLSMPILLAPMDTFSDDRPATAVTRAGGLGAGYAATDLVTPTRSDPHTRSDLRESVENQTNSIERLEPSDIAEGSYTW